MKNTINTPIISSKLLTRKSLLNANSELIEQLRDRLRAKRFRSQEGDSIKLAYIRVFIQALQVQNSILKDSELEELHRRLEVLEEMQAGLQRSEETIYTPDFEDEEDYTDETWNLQDDN